MKAITKLGALLKQSSAKSAFTVRFLHLSSFVNPRKFTSITNGVVLVANQVAYVEGKPTTILYTRTFVKFPTCLFWTIPIRTAGQQGSSVYSANF